MWAFVQLSRPWFLAGPVLLLAVGVADAGDIRPGRLLPGFAMVWMAQLTAHYVNEFADVEADRLVVSRTPFSGGSGVLVAGDLEPRVALRAALTTSVLTVVAAGWVATFAALAALFGLAALAVAWAYSMPPVRLVATGWGELVTSITVAGLLPLTGTALMGTTPSWSLGWVTVGLVAAHFAMMLVFELPDLESDRSAGKLVLGVRLGRGSTGGVVVASQVVAVSVLAVLLGSPGFWVVPGLAALATWVAVDGERALSANVAAIGLLLAVALMGTIHLAM